jgi:FHS family glucose/mannose:H+ symporter-like MFS transporter
MIKGPLEADPPSTPDALATEVSFSAFAFGGATATFALIGAVSSIYGPLLVSFSRAFHLSLPKAGEVLSVHFVGALFGVLLGWLGVKRMTGRFVLSSAMLAMAAGALGAALSHDWVVFLMFVFLIGFGFGGLDFSLNTLLARTAFAGRAFRLSVANGGYGLGAVIGPLLVIALRPRNFHELLAGIAVSSIMLSTLTRGVHAPLLRAEAKQRELMKLKVQRRPILLTFVAAYILYVAVETGASGWMAPQLHGEGYSQSVGSLVTAGFWMGLAIGRFCGGTLYRHLSEKLLVLGGLVLTIVLSLGALSSALAPYCFPLMGLVVASIFPMGLIWYTTLIPHDSDGLALMILFMMAGGVIGPGTESLMVSLVGIHIVPVVLAGFAVVNLAVFASALRFQPLHEE